MARSWLMQIREDNRNIVLLGTVLLCCSAISGGMALLEPATAPAVHARAAHAQADRRIVNTLAADETVRVVGAPFVPNVDPHRR